MAGNISPEQVASLGLLIKTIVVQVLNQGGIDTTVSTVINRSSQGNLSDSYSSSFATPPRRRDSDDCLTSCVGSDASVSPEHYYSANELLKRKPKTESLLEHKVIYW